MVDLARRGVRAPTDRLSTIVACASEKKRRIGTKSAKITFDNMMKKGKLKISTCWVSRVGMEKRPWSEISKMSV